MKTQAKCYSQFFKINDNLISLGSSALSIISSVGLPPNTKILS